MAEISGKYYYENILSNQNVTAKTNIAWVLDITHLDLFMGQKAHVFLCLDIHTNYIVASAINKKAITSSIITRSLQQAINKRFRVPPVKKLIIHSDRGTEFTSRVYNNFTIQNNSVIKSSKGSPSPVLSVLKKKLIGNSLLIIYLSRKKTKENY